MSIHTRRTEAWVVCDEHTSILSTEAVVLVARLLRPSSGTRAASSICCGFALTVKLRVGSTFAPDSQQSLAFQKQVMSNACAPNKRMQPNPQSVMRKFAACPVRG